MFVLKFVSSRHRVLAESNFHGHQGRPTDALGPALMFTVGGMVEVRFDF
jgi:hypothetical protein